MTVSVDPEDRVPRDYRARIADVADRGSVESLDTPRPSPHLARFGLAAQEDDGVTVARIAVEGARILVAAQDARFLRGSVGANHGAALQSLFERAREERPAAVVLFMASGGVRLHEANAAELSLARALRALLELRAAGVPVLAIASGDVFGGASVLACAADRLAMFPGMRIGLSGPKVIESVHGKWELDASRPAEIDAVFGAAARSRAGDVDLMVDDPDALRAWIRVAAQGAIPFSEHVTQSHALLARRAPPSPPAPPSPLIERFGSVRPIDRDGWLWRTENLFLAAPATGLAFGAGVVHALDTALLAQVGAGDAGRASTLAVVEDSAGHEVSRAAEMRFASRWLAHHAAVLALVRQRGHRVVGLLSGIGHSAAFFSNALQAPQLYALRASRVIAMEPSAIARVTGLPAASLIEDDALIGQPVRHLASLGGATIVDEANIVSTLGGIAR